MEKSHKRHIILSLVGLLITTGILTGCEDVTNNAVGERDIISEENITTSGKKISLIHSDFPGNIMLDSKNIESKERGFTLPVYLENVTEDERLDTVTLKMEFPENIRLESVQTPSGFTAITEGIGTTASTVHFLSSSLSPDSYTSVVSKSDPIFSLEMSGDPEGDITFEGGYFVIREDVILLETSAGTLEL